MSNLRRTTEAKPAPAQVLAVLRRRWVTALLVLLAGGGLGTITAEVVPTRWSATAEVALSSPDGGFAEVGAEMPTEAQRVRATELLEGVGRHLELSPEEVDRSLSVDVVADSTVLRIGFRSTDAAAAARGANQVATDFLDLRRESQRRAIETRRASLREDLASVRRLMRQTRDPDLRSGYAQRLVDLDRQLGELDRAPGAATLVRRASVPAAPAGPPWPAYLAGGLVLALAPAVVVAHWRDRRARAIRDEQWLADLLGVPVAQVDADVARSDVARLVVLAAAGRPVELVAVADRVGTGLGGDLAVMLGTPSTPFRWVEGSGAEPTDPAPGWPRVGRDQALVIDLPRDFDAPRGVLIASRCDTVVAVAVRGERVDRIQRFVRHVRWGGREPTLVLLLDPRHELCRAPGSSG